MTPLSDATAKRVRVVFPGNDRVDVTELLAHECAENLHLSHIGRATLIERIRFAVLKVSRGDVDELRRQVDLAKRDWRKVLAAAGFADSPDAHLEWYPKSAEQPAAVDALKDARH